jgi:hypothetical protein
MMQIYSLDSSQPYYNWERKCGSEFTFNLNLYNSTEKFSKSAFYGDSRDIFQYLY